MYLKYVCEGKKNLSVGSAGSVAAAMGLAGFEQTYFVLMVSYAHAKDDKARRAAFEERCALAHAHKVRVLGNEEFDYFKSWKNPVLREIAPHMPGAKPLEMARKCKPQISAAPVAARDMQRQMGEFAVKALDLPLSERDMSGLTMGLTRRAYEKIRKEIADFRRRIVAIASEDDETEQVYRLNLQLFPLSERIDNRVDRSENAEFFLNSNKNVRDED